VATEPTANGAPAEGASGSFRREAEVLRDRLLNLDRALTEEQQLPIPKADSPEGRKPPPPRTGTSVAKAEPRGRVSGDRIPSVAELPAHVAQNLPPRNILVHVYNERPEKRFVILNSQRQKQGDTTKDGFVIEEIQPDGVVLRFSGERFFNPR
jgi:general secretion pathway protein B